MHQFTLKQLLISTANIAVGCMPFTMSGAGAPYAYAGAPLIGAGFGRLFRHAGTGAMVGLLVFVVTAAICIANLVVPTR